MKEQETKLAKTVDASDASFQAWLGTGEPQNFKTQAVPQVGPVSYTHLFKVNSIDYLLKPIDFEELKAAIDKFKLLRQPLVPEVNLNAMLQLFGQNQVTYKDRFMVTVGAKLRSIQTSEIAYFSFEDRATILTTHDNLRLSVDYSLDKLTQLLNPHDFFRVNRSLLVSLSAIQVAHAYSGGKIKLELAPAFKQEVFVSGDRIADFKEWLGK